MERMDTVTSQKIAPDTLALLKLNLSHVPLSDQERRDLIDWLRRIADEYAAGEHWGASTLALLKREETR